MYQIVDATEKDYIEVNRLVRQGQDDHVAGDDSVFKSIDFVMPKDYYMELLEQSDSKIFIAKADRIVGFAVITIEAAPNFPSLVEQNYAYIHDFGVDRSVKRQGIGSLLFEACKKRTGRNNKTSVKLNLTYGNSTKKLLSFMKSKTRKWLVER